MQTYFEDYNYNRNDGSNKKKCDGAKKAAARDAHIKVRLLSPQHPFQLAVILFPPENWCFFGNISLKQTTHLSGSERQEWAAAISFILDSIFSCDCEEGAWVQIWINNYLLLWSSHCMLVRVELLCLQSHLVIYAVMRVSHQLPWPCKPSWSTQWELSCQPQEPDNLEKVTALDLGFAVVTQTNDWEQFPLFSVNFQPGNDSASFYWPNFFSCAPPPIEQKSGKKRSPF